VRRLRRVHKTGTEVVLTQHNHIWRIQINLREPTQHQTTITAYVERSLSLAKQLADKEVLKHGHTCTKACNDWVDAL